MIKFKLNLLLALYLSCLSVGCTVVQDYGEDYLEWRDLGVDATSPTDPDDIPDTTDASDDASADTSLADALDATDSLEDDASQMDVEDTTEPTDADIETDTNTNTSVWAKDALFDVRGYIRLIEFHDKVQGNQWKTTAHEIRARIHGDIPPNTLELVQESGACKLYLAGQAVCPEPCSNGQICTAEGQCAEPSSHLNVGAINIDGLSSASNETVTLTYGEGGDYTVQNSPIKGTELFEPEDIIKVQIEGLNGLGTVDVQVAGVTDMQHQNSQEITLSDAENYVFTWEPSNQEEVVELVLKTGPWTANQPPEGVITCAADDGDGSISIPVELIQQFPYFDGLSNDQHPSLVRRLKRTVIDTATGPIDVSVISESYLRTVH